MLHQIIKMFYTGILELSTLILIYNITYGDRPKTTGWLGSRPVRGVSVAQAILIQAHWGKENMSEE